MLPFVVELELRAIDEALTSEATNRIIFHMVKQIDEYEVELNDIIEVLTADQMEYFGIQSWSFGLHYYIQLQ